MSLLAAAGLGGTAQSANGVAANIREEAKQAFAERMADKQFDQSVQLEGIRHTNENFMTDKRIEADNARAADNREHESGLVKSRLDAQADEAKKNRDFEAEQNKLDRTHDLQVETQKLERALAKASSSGSNKGDETTRKTYELLIEKKYELHDSLQLNGETDKAKAIWNDIVRLEQGMREQFGVNMPDLPQPTLDSITQKILSDSGLENTPENIKELHDDMRKQPQFAHFFEGIPEQDEPKNEEPGIISSAIQQTKEKEFVDPLSDPLAQKIASADSERAAKDRAQREKEEAESKQEGLSLIAKSREGAELREASQEMAKAYKRIQAGNGDAISAAQLAKLHGMIDKIKNNGMTEVERTQAEAILAYIQSRS